MEFSPFNNVVKPCLQGRDLEGKNKSEQAEKIFLQGWDEATNDFEKFLAAHYVARHQKNASGKLNWLEMALQFALNVNDDAVNSALPSLYLNIAKCYEDPLRIVGEVTEWLRQAPEELQKFREKLANNKGEIIN